MRKLLMVLIIVVVVGMVYADEPDFNIKKIESVVVEFENTEHLRKQVDDLVLCVRTIYSFTNNDYYYYGLANCPTLMAVVVIEYPSNDQQGKAIVWYTWWKQPTDGKAESHTVKREPNHEN